MTVIDKDEAIEMVEQAKKKRKAHYHRLRQVNHIQSPEALFKVFDKYEIVDPDFDDEHFMNIFNYSMRITEAYRGKDGGIGNYVPKGKPKPPQYEPKLLPKSDRYYRRLIAGHK